MKILNWFRLRNADKKLSYHEEALRALRLQIADHERGVRVAREQRAKIVGKIELKG